VQSADVEALPTHVLVNSKGTEVHISPVGAVIERINIPDRTGKHTDIVLGFDKKTPYAVGIALHTVLQFTYLQ
jgi:galactose mutarotase-like enzyme